ncbi:MAG: hypothetical protein ABIJ34_06625, partial [archaeon]|nr:hypothetical protein [Candidatus Micrarchaeota archaeon]
LDLDLPEDKHIKGPKKYSLKSLAKALLFRHLLRLSSVRELSRKLQNWTELRKACGFHVARRYLSVQDSRRRKGLYHWVY